MLFSILENISYNRVNLGKFCTNSNQRFKETEDLFQKSAEVQQLSRILFVYIDILVLEYSPEKRLF